MATAEARRAARPAVAAIRRRPAARPQRGLTMVGLLVGTAIGLAAVAAGSALVAAGGRDARAVTTETRLLQDLRTASDIVARDLRRAGHWAGAASGVRTDDGSAPLANPYAAFAPDDGASSVVRYAYARDASENHAVDADERFGFRLRGGAIELQLGDGNWQSLTDAQTLVVTAFSVEPCVDETPLDAFCPDACPAGSTTCPPRQQVRSVVVTIAGRAAADARIARQVDARARLRNDTVVGSCT